MSQYVNFTRTGETLIAFMRRTIANKNALAGMEIKLVFIEISQIWIA